MPRQQNIIIRQKTLVDGNLSPCSTKRETTIDLGNFSPDKIQILVPLMDKGIIYWNNFKEIGKNKAKSTNPESKGMMVSSLGMRKSGNNQK